MHQPELRNRLAKGNALLGETNSVAEHIPGSSDGRCAQLVASDVQDVKGNAVAFSDRSEQVLERYHAIGKHQGAGRRAADTELMLLGAHAQTRSARLDQEGRKLFSVNLGEHGEQAGHAGIGDPHLLPVQDIAFAIGRKLGLSADVHRI